MNLVNDKEKTQGILVDIDCLFDTRFAVLESMNPEIADSLLVNGYFTRERDEFPGIDTYTFREQYAKRNLNTLMHSKPTSFLMYLKQTIARFIYTNSTEGIFLPTELILNIHPYRLNMEEINEFVLCLKYYTENLIPVRVIDSPLKDITPNYLDEKVSGFFTYDWNQWFTLHGDALLKKRLDSVVLLAPRIYPLSSVEAEQQLAALEEERKKSMVSLSEEDREMQEFVKEIGGESAMIERIYSLLIGFTFLEAREFSLALPDGFQPPNLSQETT